MQEVMPQVHSDELERGVLDYWEKEDIFAESLANRKDNEQFTFYDGPPYATGKPHYGHILQSAIKDTVLRFKTMQGYYVPRRVGWDTHGLPIENIVEKELGIKTKREIEDDIERFNKACRETVFRYVDQFTSTLKRMGRWADYDGAYSTLDRDYMESVWWVFSKLWEKDLVYKAFRSTPYCTRCATPLSNFEVAGAYKDRVDLAVYVALPVVDQEHLSLLIWTTTPWTLPANVAVAFSPELEYVTAVIDGKRYVLAKERVANVLGETAEIERTWTAEELGQLHYEPLYEVNEVKAHALGYGLVPGEHVTADEGTGLVHMAPAFGEEDAAVGKKYELPVVQTVDKEGKFLEMVDERWVGLHVFAANKLIAEDIEERGLLLKQEQYTHSYPHCWRCDTPLIYYALDTWFVNVQQIKDRLLENSAKINWVPEHVKEGRFKKGIEMAPDWAVTRNRFWSTPAPLWECDSADCEERVCVGSVEQLRELSGVGEREVADLHRPYVDEITWSCKECSGTMRRIPEVLDVWFDAGSMPYAQWHFPFENEAVMEQAYPADFIVEAIEQTRLWFYVMHVLGEAVQGGPAYLNAIGAGIIFAEDGRKLSKKLKNYPEVEPVLADYGADVLRFYLLSSASLGEPYRFSEKDMRQVKRSVYMTLWNVYSFFTRYAAVHGWQPTGGATTSEHVLDRWIVARTEQLQREVISEGNRYRIDAAARAFVPYIADLSNWYLRRSRDRFQSGSSQKEREEAFATLHEVLVCVCRLLAPFMPFVTEEMYRNLTGERSVHLGDLPAELPDKEPAGQILEMMQQVREVVSEGLAVRAEAKLKVRQPLAMLTIRSTEKWPEEVVEIVREEVNVKSVEIDPNQAALVRLNVELTDELRAEGAARDIVRQGQVLRRKSGYELNEHIVVWWQAEDPTVAAWLLSQKMFVMEELQAEAVVETDEGLDAVTEVKVAGSVVKIGVGRIR